MLKKEFKEVIKQTALFFILMAFLILGFKLRSVFGNYTFNFTEYTLIFYQLFIFFFSFFFGISMFSSEIRNNSFEYLLTLPYTRSKLLWLKIIPRFSLLVILYLIYLLLLTLSTTDPFLIAPVSFLAIYFSLFFISTSLSVLRGNFVGNSILTFILFIIFLFSSNFVAWLVTKKYFGASESFKLRIFTVSDTFPFSLISIILLGLLISAPFIISLFYGFKKVDVRSSGRYLKRFFTLLFPLVLVGMAVSYFVLSVSAGEPDAHYFITKKGVILKYDYSGTYVLSKEGKRKLPDFYPYRRNFYETDKAVYSSVWHWENNPGGNIERFDPAFKTSENIYSPPEKNFLSRKLYGYKDTLIFVESSGKKYSWNKSTDNQIVFLNIKTGKIEKVKLQFDSLKLVGVAETENNVFWVGYHVENMGVTVYTIDAQGNTLKILRSRKSPRFVNEQLITFDREWIVFGKFDTSGYKEINRIRNKDDLIFPYHYFSSELNGLDIKYFYAKLMKKGTISPEQKLPPLEFVGIDLESHSIFRFHNDRVTKGMIYPVFPGETFFLSLKGRRKIQFNGIFRMEGRQMKLIKDFKEERKLWEKDFGMAGNGFGIGKGDDAKFFLFPGLKEIEN